MALSHTVIETRYAGTRWRTRLRVVDSDTGKQYIRNYQSKIAPDQGRLDALGALAESRIQNELDYEANVMNPTSDIDGLRDDLYALKLDIVRKLRQNNGVSLEQAQNYLNGKYPEYALIFPILYARWKARIGVATWAQFKQWVIDYKFRDID